MTGSDIALYEYFDYEDKKKIRQAYQRYFQLLETSYQGNDTTLAIVVDLELALAKSRITERQRYIVVNMLVYGEVYYDVANDLDVPTKLLYDELNRALTEIRRFLTGDKHIRGWTPKEIEYLRSHPYLSNKELATELNRPLENVKRKMTRLGVRKEAS